ncbi:MULTISPECIES: hypothetical protein [unclassified Neisseria]|jgi:hypothetical protein|nr:hypothetical protein HMPREF2954_10925 [Neisseria sp. HMSC067H09]
MKFINLTILSLVISLICLSVCEASNHEKNSKTQLSTLKEKNNMQPSSPMLNEIFACEKYTAGGKVKDVTYIVSEYLPIGSSKEEVINKLSDMNQHYTDEGNVIYAGYGRQVHPMIPYPSVSIVLKFNNLGYLEDIDSKFHYAQ